MQSFGISNCARVALAGMIAVSIAACDDTPFDLEEHGEAHGVVITAMDGAVIAESEEAEPWVFADDGAALTLAAEASREVRIWFVDGDGDRFQVDGDDELSMAVTVASTAIATYESHGDHGDFHGVAPGSTTATISLMHGDHDDFTSQPLPVSVVAP